ncbi:MAG: hypothetical protein Q9212_007046 [Teloschistes hypoglaucus]
MAGLSPAAIAYQRAHIHDDRSKDIIAALGVTLGFAIITVVLRFLSRHITRAPLAGDDWTIVAALVDDSVNRSIWSGVEICVAIVCANLVILRPILHYLRTGKAVRVGSSKGTSRYSGRSGQRRWTFRNVKTPDKHVSSDGAFHRLEQENGAQGTEYVERQKYELPLMSPIASPLVPDKAHFGQLHQTRLQTALLPDERV